MSKNLNNRIIVVSIETVRGENYKTIHYEYKKRSDEERPMALDVLMQAQNTSIPDLAFRYGCRARNCGVCTIDINDRPRVACRARVKNGDKLSAIATLPVLSDLVVKRDGISRQLRGLKTIAKGNDLNIDAPKDYHEPSIRSRFPNHRVSGSSIRELCRECGGKNRNQITLYIG